MGLVLQSRSQTPFVRRLRPNKNPKPTPKPTPKTLTKPLSVAPLSIATRDQSNLHQNHQRHQQQQQQKHKDLLVETFHYNNRLKDLIEEISRDGSDPAEILERDGDWTKDQLWAVVVLLLEDERVTEALQVFDLWTNKETSRVADVNYMRIIRLLCERNFMEQAVSTFHDMEKYGIIPSLAMYNDIIHGFARVKEFDEARETLGRMVKTGVLPTPETYNGLIRAYGDYGLYDEMCKCVKKMESEGCFPNEVTYNLLIAEFARGRLLERMEGVYRTLLSKRMNLQPHTLVTMLEAYADLGILDKMEQLYRRLLHSKAFMKENLIRELAMVYIEHQRFVRLEEFGNEICSRTGRTDLIWCVLLLSCACLLSRKGIESVIREMDAAKVEFNITFANILGLFYLKTRDFRALDGTFSRVETHNLIPDMVTFGILFDACKIGYSGTRVLEAWKRNCYLEREVEMDTDPLVLAAFGKGSFIMNCEKTYSSLKSKGKERKLWTYGNLISLVFGGAKGGQGDSLQLKD